MNHEHLTSGQEVLGWVDQAIKKDFDSNRRILSFDEYLVQLGENPEKQLRGSSHYLVDMMDYFGKTEESPYPRFKVFDFPIEGISLKVVGHEKIQNQIYRALKAFTRQKINNRLILLHGPNGSAKTSIIQALMGGLERYSRQPAGATYSFNWVFPVERYTKGGMGMNTYSTVHTPHTSFAKLPDEEISGKITCDMKDHPLLLIPVEQRQDFLEKLIGKSRTKEIWGNLSNYLTQGDLCHRCRQIADSLLIAHGGDFKKLLMHVQVERFYLARRYRKGLVTIEPQMHVDAQYHQLTYNRNLTGLPPSIQNINLFTLTGDLVDGNRGLIEFSDLLKRPVDSFKYLLSACEIGSINVGNSIAYLDSVMLGSTNDLQLDAFKEFPDFSSFKGRIELIRVPYLLSYTQEQEIYEPQLPQLAGEKHVAPHVGSMVALWAVLTRLKKPNSINYPPNVSTLISNISPMEKARCYDSGDLPNVLAPEEKKLLRASLKRLWEEYSNIPYYEGRMGASAREMKALLLDAAQNPEFHCLSPLAVFKELEEFIKRVTENEFLKQEVKDGYHDSAEFINIVRTEYLNLVDREVRDSMGLYDSAQWEDFLKKYVSQISIFLKKEKIKNPITGKSEDPDFSMITEFEKIVDAPQDSTARDAFRQNIISQVGVWSLDHPRETMAYSKVFPEFWKRLEKHYFESQKTLLKKVSDALVYDTREADLASESGKLALQTVKNMETNLGYCHFCAKEVITFLMRTRY